MTSLKGKARAKKSKREKNIKTNRFFLHKKDLLSKIRKWDDPILSEIGEDVESVSEVKDIIKQIKATLSLSENGVGLSASQIGYNKRLIAIMPNRASKNITIMINPEIIEVGGDLINGMEGCLSYPDIYVPVERYDKVVVSFLTEDFKKETKEFLGFEARVVQHEYDHTHGECKVRDNSKK